MSVHLENKANECKNFFEERLTEYFQNRMNDNPGRKKVYDSMWYSLKAGGKRFRPVLALLLSDELGVHPDRVIDWSIAVEMIHTYSLIHDDLPCMDNDDFRRGIPTNHKVYGENLALLAGDALIFEAFHVLNSSENFKPETKVRLQQILIESSSIDGMITGQVMDIFFQELSANHKNQFIDQIHHLKTGALIRAAAEGAAVACGLPIEKVTGYSEFGALLGYCFQVKDDILDTDSDAIHAPNLTKVMSKVDVEKLLIQASNECLKILGEMGQANGFLAEMVRQNLTRTK